MIPELGQEALLVALGLALYRRLVNWIWVVGAILTLGAALAIVPERGRTE